jgi:hypothetical protein
MLLPAEGATRRCEGVWAATTPDCVSGGDDGSQAGATGAIGAKREQRQRRQPARAAAATAAGASGGGDGDCVIEDMAGFRLPDAEVAKIDPVAMVTRESARNAVAVVAA